MYVISNTTNPKAPRSLVTCAQEVCWHMDRLARAYGRTTEAQTAARALVASLAELSVEDVFDEGLHEFLTRMIREVGKLSSVVTNVYLNGEAL